MRQRGRRDVRVNVVVQWEDGKPLIVVGLGTATLDGTPDEWADVAERLVDALAEARRGANCHRQLDTTEISLKGAGE